MPWNQEVLNCVQTNDVGWVTYDSYIALWLYVYTLVFPTRGGGAITLHLFPPRTSLVKIEHGHCKVLGHDVWKV